jgi:hypothetical protein
VPGSFLSAFGAARGVDGALEEMLLPDSVSGKFRRRRQRRLSLACAACVAAIGFAVWSVDQSRERALDRIVEELAAIEPSAVGAVELRERLAAVDRELAAIDELARARANPLGVLAALSERIPPEATVLLARASGDNWQIDGTALDAAAIIPMLDADNRIEDVRFLSASTRFREDGREYETFSIAFHVPPTR